VSRSGRSSPTNRAIDQQDDVALDGVELRFGDEEVLPEDGHIDRLAHAFERVGAPAEVRRLGEHAQRGRAAGDHSLCERDRVVLAGALRRRAGGFHLGDQRDAPVRLGAVERRPQIARLDGDLAGSALGRAVACSRQDRSDRRGQLGLIVHYCTLMHVSVHKTCGRGHRCETNLAMNPDEFPLDRGPRPGRVPSI